MPRTREEHEDGNLCTSNDDIARGVFRTMRSRDRDVVLVRRTSDLRCREFGMGREWGGNGEGMGRGRSVYEQPGAKVDGIASRQKRVSK
jgi:hypothetical protein